MKNTTGFQTYTTGEAVERARRVKFSGATVVYADADAVGIGVTLEPAANGASVAVQLFTAPGTVEVEAAGAFAAGALSYAAADGKVDDSGTVTVGDFEQAASGSGSIVSMIPRTPVGAAGQDNDLPVKPSTGTYNLVVAGNGTATWTAPTLPTKPATGTYQLVVAGNGTATWTAPTLPAAPAEAGDYKLTISALGVATWVAIT